MPPCPTACTAHDGLPSAARAGAGINIGFTTAIASAKEAVVMTTPEMMAI